MGSEKNGEKPKAHRSWEARRIPMFGFPCGPYSASDGCYQRFPDKAVEIIAT